MLYDHVKYFVFGSGTSIIDLHTVRRWASFVGTEERQLTHGYPAKYKPQLWEFSSRSAILLRSGWLNGVIIAELACFGKVDSNAKAQTWIYLLALAGSGDCLLYGLFDRGRSSCIGGAILDVGRRHYSLSPTLFVCLPVAQFCRLRSYCASLAAATWATFCDSAIHSLTQSVGEHQSGFSTVRDATDMVPCITWRYSVTDSVLQDSPAEALCFSCTKADTSIHHTSSCVCRPQQFGNGEEKKNNDDTADPHPSYSNVARLPEFLLWPRPKHYAVWRFLADLVQYIITRCTVLSSLDYIDFMRRKQVVDIEMSKVCCDLWKLSRCLYQICYPFYRQCGGIE